MHAKVCAGVATMRICFNWMSVPCERTLTAPSAESSCGETVSEWMSECRVRSLKHNRYDGKLLQA